MKNALLVIDMQNVFSREEWHVENIDTVKRNVLKLCQSFRGRTIFTRHLPNPAPKGTWQTYNMAFSHLESDPSNWELMDEFKPFSETVIVKYTYSCFGADGFQNLYNRYHEYGFILAGVETDFCVLASLLDLVDAGCPVTLVTDAVGAEDMRLNDAIIKICENMPSQVSLKTTDEIISQIDAGSAE